MSMAFFEANWCLLLESVSLQAALRKHLLELGHSSCVPTKPNKAVVDNRLPALSRNDSVYYNL
jgi:hypothetical protein